MSNVDPTKTWLNRAEAAGYVTARGAPVTKAQLAKLACLGGGPPYRRWGNRTLYTAEELDAWLESRMRVPTHTGKGRTDDDNC
jgi:hypothetical protein